MSSSIFSPPRLTHGFAQLTIRNSPQQQSLPSFRPIRVSSGKGKVHRYNPIKAYAAIGNTRTVALVSLDGSIDWCCMPRFDSPSVFARLLDAEKGGAFTICPLDHYDSEQRYERDTNILKTSFRIQNRIVRVTDFMPITDSVNGIEAPGNT